MQDTFHFQRVLQHLLSASPLGSASSPQRRRAGRRPHDVNSCGLKWVKGRSMPEGYTMLHGLHLGDWKKNLHRTEVLCRQQRSPFPPEEFAVLDLTAWILVTCPWASKNTPKWRFGWLKHLISRDIEVILWRSYGDFLKSYGKLNTTTLHFGDDSAIHF